jgi:hypothetical protein
MSCKKMYQYFFNILGLSKVLVTTGYDEGSNKIEVIDLANSTNVCQPSVLADYPLDAFEASGGLLNNNIALICGGSNPQYPQYPQYLDECFAITANAIEDSVKLTKPRSAAASVVVNGTTLWITGGYVQDLNYETKTTEFVQLNGSSPGPDLPHKVGYHCLVSLNDSTVILIGGMQNGLYLEDTNTFYYNNDNKTWTEGPSLINGRFWHSCALFKNPLNGNAETVIVTGGYNDKGTLVSTEFLNLDSDSWTLGRNLYIIQS